MKNLLLLLVGAVLLTALTSVGVWYGYTSEGGPDIIQWYAYPGLPFAFVVLLLFNSQLPPAVTLAAGLLVQFACCLAVLGLAWAAWHGLRPGSGPGSNPGKGGTNASFLSILAVHLLLGVPLAALTHSLVQLAYEPDVSLVDAGVLPVHFLLGLVVGLPVLAPAYALQACLFTLLARSNANGLAQIAAGAALQAALVGLWAATVGVQPSLDGNFLMAPVLITAAAVVGGLVALLTCLWVKR